MEINIVCGSDVISHFKKSKYFKSDLGFASSINDTKSGDRIYSTKDEFAVHYNIKYKTAIYKNGKVGNYCFYLDYYIRDGSIATYCDELEYIIKFDYNKARIDGIDSYLGYIVRSVLMNHTNSVTQSETSEKISVVNNNKKPNGNAVLTSPGSATYEDVQEYLKNRKKI